MCLTGTEEKANGIHTLTYTWTCVHRKNNIIQQFILFTWLYWIWNVMQLLKFQVWSYLTGTKNSLTFVTIEHQILTLQSMVILSRVSGNNCSEILLKLFFPLWFTLYHLPKKMIYDLSFDSKHSFSLPVLVLYSGRLDLLSKISGICIKFLLMYLVGQRSTLYSFCGRVLSKI